MFFIKSFGHCLFYSTEHKKAQIRLIVTDPQVPTPSSATSNNEQINTFESPHFRLQ